MWEWYAQKFWELNSVSDVPRAYVTTMNDADGTDTIQCVGNYLHADGVSLCMSLQHLM